MKYAMLLIGAVLACTASAADYEVGDRLAPGATGEEAQNQFQEIGWDDLLPEDWDPMNAIQGLDLDAMADVEDADPRAAAALQELLAAWVKAPTNPAIDGKAVRIAGFMVPLEYGKKAIREFLLVPYFGACIHVPPPPANQIIEVLAVTPYETRSPMDPVWVEGVIERVGTQTDLGDTGYRLRAQKVEIYE